MSKISIAYKRAPLAAVMLAVIPSLAWAEQSLTQAIDNQLRTVAEPCANLLGDDAGNAVLTGGLLEICARNSPVGSQASTQGPSAGNTHSLASNARSLLQNADGETGAVQKIMGNWSLFLNIEQETLNRDASTLADAFDSDALRINAGINYAFNDNSHLGMAIVKKTHEGDYQQGGDFSNESLGVKLLGEFGIGENGFLQILIGQDKTDTDRNRATFFSDTFDGALLFSRTAKPHASFSYNETEAATLLGTQWTFGGTTLSPFIALNWQQIDFDTFSESGDSGLEITTYDDTTKSLQGILGAQASWAITTGWGVWAPQIGANFINEFDNKSRQVQVSFTGDKRAKKFTYDTEEGDRNYLAFSAGSVFIMKNGWQFYVNAETYAAYDNYSRSVISGGLRWEL